MQSVQEIVCQEITVGGALQNSFRAGWKGHGVLYGVHGDTRVYVAVEFEPTFTECASSWKDLKRSAHQQSAPTALGSLDFKISGYFAFGILLILCIIPGDGDKAVEDAHG